ncbi:MAG: lipocalin family protein [Bacteroidales bacterium]|jgi:hypothetical protein|nr:lipocalin family protein [Bacteroidales bacterium]
MRINKRIIIIAGLSCLIAGCQTKNKDIIGIWTEPIVGQVGKKQGIEFNKDGSAKSINMATLVIKSYIKEGNKLKLVSKSIGNGNEFMDTMTYDITTLNEKELKLSYKGNVVWDLKKK